MPRKILVRRPQIWIAEIEYYEKMSSHAQIGPQGAEKQLCQVRVGGGGWVVVCRQTLRQVETQLSWSFYDHVNIIKFSKEFEF